MVESVRNSGVCNTGSYNAGDYNTGSGNTGNCNAGRCNAGDYNSGDYNSGSWNTGNWNSGSWNTGYFNTIDAGPRNSLFNRGTCVSIADVRFPEFLYFGLTVWVPATGDLKTLSYKEAFAQAYEEASEEAHAELFSLPNFDPRVFEEISGVDTSEEYTRWLERNKLR